MRIVIALLAVAALLGGTAIAEAKKQGHAHNHAFHQHKDNPTGKHRFHQHKDNPTGKHRFHQHKDNPTGKHRKRWFNW